MTEDKGDLVENPNKEIVKKELTDWRLQYIVDYFLPKTAEWKVSEDQEKMEVTIPIKDKDGETELSYEITGDNLILLPKDLSKQEGSELEYKATNDQEIPKEGGLLLLLDSISFSLPETDVLEVKKVFPDNKRFQDLKFIFWPAPHISHVGSSIYYPRINTLKTPFPLSLSALMGVAHEVGHCIDSDDYPEDYKDIEEDFIDKYIKFYLGNYQRQAKERRASIF